MARSGAGHASQFPGVSLDALKFLHQQRKILFHGHEPLDTDSHPNLEGEYWLMHNGYTQAEGVANLDQVPEKGCLVAIGYPKFQGGTGGYARYIAICPPDWKYGVTIAEGARGAAAQERQDPAVGRQAPNTRTQIMVPSEPRIPRASASRTTLSH